LKRSDSLPGRLPSNPAPRAEIKPERKPITRAQPDANPPQDFSPPPIKKKPPTLCGIPLRTKKEKREDERASEGRIKDGAVRKGIAFQHIAYGMGYNPDIRGDSEFMDVIRAHHPRFDEYSAIRKNHALQMLKNHPRYVAGLAQSRNEVSRLPNGPTATRKMEPNEQRFLTDAFRRIKEDIREKPFHIHGEAGVVGNKEGEVTYFGYNPGGSVSTPNRKGDRYHLHTHPPFMEPLTSSASGEDHKEAAMMYTIFDNKTTAYVTNGRDVLHISPNSTELVKLIPDPEVEKELGKFPVAFRVPDPQLPPKPFSNHEAPAAFKKWDSQK
jgi:hypothetical protein